MKYKVIKDLPFAKVGEEVEIDNLGQHWVVGGFHWTGLWGDPRDSGFFEEVRPRRFYPEHGDSYYYVRITGKVARSRFSQETWEEECWGVGNMFQREEQAEELARRWEKCAEEYQQELLQK